MDKLDKYEQIIIEKFEEYATSWNNSDEQITTQTIIDLKGKHYQLMRYGWVNEVDYIHNCVFHIDIIDDKGWLQENRTDIFIAEELVQSGIDKKDIVLGLLPPQRRKDSEYAYAL